MPREIDETLVIDSSDPIKSIEVKDGTARVGSYAVRFSGPDEKDLQGEYFTKSTYFGARKGDGADVLFNHGQAPNKAFDEICGYTFGAAKATADEIGLFVEHTLDLANEYEKAVSQLVAAGKLKWSSGTAAHMAKKGTDGEIQRWPIAEFSYTPTPAEPRLPAIAPLKSVLTANEHEWTPIEDSLKAVWSTAYMDDLPDSAFLYVEAGGKKDSDGKTTPRSLRHFPYKDASGSVDLPHLRNALARIPQSGVSQAAKDSAIAHAQRLLKEHSSGKAVDNPDESDSPKISIKQKQSPLMDENKTQEQIDAAVKLRTTEIENIYAIAEKFGARDEAKKFISEGKSLGDFQHFVLTEKLKAEVVETDPNVGLSKKEIKQWSLTKALRDLITTGSVQGLEKEASIATAKALGREPKGFFIPNDAATTSLAEANGLSDPVVKSLNSAVAAMTKALNVSTFSAGGAFVATDVLGSELIDLLRNKMFVTSLGARALSGLVGNVAIPRQTGGATGYWLSESASNTESDQTVGQIGLTPHRLGAYTAYQKELLFQASLDVEGFVRDDLMKILAIARDLAALNGSGAAGQPVGIINWTGIGSVTFSAAATWAKMIDFETQVANANADLGSMAYLATPNTRAKLKAATKIASSQYSNFIWETGKNGSGEVNGYRAEATLQVPSDKVIFGNWNDLLLADWAGMDVVVNPYAGDINAQIRVVIHEWVDNAVRHAGSFTVSTDSGAQ